MTGGRPVARGRQELWVRLTFSPLAFGAVLALLAWHQRLGSSAPTDVALALLAGAAAAEVALMLGRVLGPSSLLVPIAFSTALAGLGLFIPDDPAGRGTARALLLAAAVLAAFVPHLCAPREGDLERLLATLFPVVYVGLLLGLFRELGDGPAGAGRIALVVVASKMSDAGGWLVGTTIGRHRMLPSVSPGKTWEGTLGGLAFAAATAAGWVALLGPVPGLAGTPAAAAAFGVVVGAASIVAGLTHSALKRRCGVKHASALLPGVGGVLDIVDSLLLAGPAAWLWSLAWGLS